MSKIIQTIMLLLVIVSTELYADEALEIKNLQDRLEHKQRQKELETIKQQPAELEYNPQDNIITNSSCLNIEKITISGNSIYSNKQLKLITDKYLNNCINLRDIQNIINDINIVYFEAGYITSRALLPTNQTKLNEGILQLAILEGKIDKITLYERKIKEEEWIQNDNSLKISMALPKFSKQIFNLRTLEQAVDNFASVSSNDTSYEIIPHDELSGYSNIKINNIIAKPYEITLTFNNAGSKETGEDLYNINTSFDNILNLNDNLNLYYASSYGENSDYKNNTSEYLNYSIPFGNYNFSYLLSRSSYRLGSELTQSTYYSFGNTVINNFTVNRNLKRGQFYKSNLELDLSLKNIKSYNEVLDIKVANESGTRKLSIAEIAYINTIYSKYGTFLIKPSYIKGLTIFDALDDDTSSYDEQAQYEALALYLYYSKTFNSLPLNYNFTFDSKLSKDNLFSSEAFTIGGKYSVRGFKDEYLQGDSGLYLRNNFVFYPEFFNKNIYPEFFIDYGFTKLNNTSSHDYISGTGVTIHGNYKNLTSSFTYAQAIHTPASLAKENHSIYMSISYSY